MEKPYLSLLLKLTTLVVTAAWGPGRDRPGRRIYTDANCDKTVIISTKNNCLNLSGPVACKMNEMNLKMIYKALYTMSLSCQT